MKIPLISVIVVSYNTRELTGKCIEAVFASKGFKKDQIEVIVVDNNSTDDTVDYIGRHFEQFRLIVNQENRGFGAANNQGALAANGQYLLFLNSDAFLDKYSLRILVDLLANHKNYLSVGPQLIYSDGSLQQSAGFLPTPIRILAWMWGLDKLPLIKNLFSNPYHLYDLSGYTKSQYPEWLMGACILLRRDEFLSVDGFDESIFMYAEEVELYIRLKAKFGKKLCLTPKTQVIHLGRSSSIQANTKVLVSELRGVAYVYAKHYPNMLWFIRLVIYTGVILRIIIFSTMPSRKEALIEYQKYFNHS